ncbi:MAG TPA: heme-binding protein, partial [Planctomycetaceae bacterium]|nr:heme-binding protein [Planctomycetaceae bacterium]
MPFNRMRLTVGCLMAVCLCGSVSDAGKKYSQAPEISPSQTEESPAEPQAANKLSQLLQEGPKPTWIWGADDNKTYQLTKSFETKAVSARLIATGDNHMSVSLNGIKVASSDTWEQPVEVDVTKHLKQGENSLTADVRNAGGVAAFILKLVLVDESGKAEYILSDKSWKAGTPQAQPVPVRTITELGGGPWKNVFSQVSTSGVPPNVFQLQPGFQVEKLFTVPKEELGSWVAIALDDKGRIIASDQGDKGLFRITPPAIGSKGETIVEQLDVKMSSCQGMLHAFGALYCSVNGGPGSGLYRLKDTNGDDQYDSVEKLREFRGGGEHGPHALRLSPDGKSIYAIAGNHTRPPFDAGEDLTNPDYSSRIPTNWGEDLLLPRQWDANGHARGILAPGGWIAKTDPDGKTWEIVSIGYRNPYDMDFNADGELFAYDADMEWDFGSPWYRPTRVVHAVNGSEFGWRSGTGKWPTYYPDSLPPVVDIGPGSPVGVAFGYGAKFPAKYQKALYLCDWTFGTMYAIHLTPQGSTYVGEKTEFLSRSPLPLTDVVIGVDGAMYFTVGGRGTQSELYRVTYVGEESTDPVDARDTQFAEDRERRKDIEAYQDPRHRSERSQISTRILMRSMNDEDRFTRYAAMISLSSRENDIDLNSVYLYQR